MVEGVDVEVESYKEKREVLSVKNGFAGNLSLVGVEG